MKTLKLNLKIKFWGVYCCNRGNSSSCKFLQEPSYCELFDRYLDGNVEKISRPIRHKKCIRAQK